MVKKEKFVSTKQKMNMEMKSILELLDKTLFLKMTDEEKLKNLEYICSCRLRYLELEKQLILEKQTSGKKIDNYLYVSKNHYSNY